MLMVLGSEMMPAPMTVFMMVVTVRRKSALLVDNVLAFPALAIYDEITLFYAL